MKRFMFPLIALFALVIVQPMLAESADPMKGEIVMLTEKNSVRILKPDFAVKVGDVLPVYAMKVRTPGMEGKPVGKVRITKAIDKDFLEAEVVDGKLEVSDMVAPNPK